MCLRMTDRRESRLKHLQTATRENTQSKALDVGAECYIRVSRRVGASVRVASVVAVSLTIRCLR